MSRTILELPKVRGSVKAYLHAPFPYHGVFQVLTPQTRGYVLYEDGSLQSSTSIKILDWESALVIAVIPATL